MTTRLARPAIEIEKTPSVRGADECAGRFGNARKLTQRKARRPPQDDLALGDAQVEIVAIGFDDQSRGARQRGKFGKLVRYRKCMAGIARHQQQRVADLGIGERQDVQRTRQIYRQGRSAVTVGRACKLQRNGCRSQMRRKNDPEIRAAGLDCHLRGLAQDDSNNAQRLVARGIDGRRKIAQRRLQLCHVERHAPVKHDRRSAPADKRRHGTLGGSRDDDHCTIFGPLRMKCIACLCRLRRW
jgi:hypothetical protein